MRRFLGQACLIACIWLLAGQVITAQDDEIETRPGSTTWLGDTGLWFVPSGEILPDGKWSISGYRANLIENRACRTSAISSERPQSASTTVLRSLAPSGSTHEFVG